MIRLNINMPPAEKIGLDNAKKDKLFYFVANVVVYRQSDGRCLILKRDAREKVHPNKYAVPGGKLEWKDLDITRPTRMYGDGIDIEGRLVYINNVTFIRPDGIPVVLVKFAAKYKQGKVLLEKGAFTDFTWVNAEEVKQYDCIQGVKEEVSETTRIFSSE